MHGSPRSSEALAGRTGRYRPQRHRLSGHCSIQGTRGVLGLENCIFTVFQLGFGFCLAASGTLSAHRAGMTNDQAVDKDLTQPVEHLG